MVASCATILDGAAAANGLDATGAAMARGAATGAIAGDDAARDLRGAATGAANGLGAGRGAGTGSGTVAEAGPAAATDNGRDTGCAVAAAAATAVTVRVSAVEALDNVDGGTAAGGTAAGGTAALGVVWSVSSASALTIDRRRVAAPAFSIAARTLSLAKSSAVMLPGPLALGLAPRRTNIPAPPSRVPALGGAGPPPRVCKRGGGGGVEERVEATQQDAGYMA